MKHRKLWSFLSVLAVAVVLVFAIRAVNPANATFTIPDPCANQQRQVAAINVSTATTTNVVSAVAGEGIYVCGVFLNVSTLSDTIKFEYGTTASTACDTGATALTGAIATPASTPTAPYINTFAAGFTQMVVPTGNQLCIVTTGSSPGVQGFITYVQG